MVLRAPLGLVAVGLLAAVGCAGPPERIGAMPGHRMGAMPGPGMEMPGHAMPAGAHVHLPYLSRQAVAERYRFRIETDPPVLKAGEAARLHLFILDARGRPVETLQVHHERLAHLLVVSENLEEFHHLHAEDEGPLTPEARREGRFSVPITLRWGGRYLLSLDAVDGGVGIHQDLDLRVEGPPQPATRWNLGRTRTAGPLTLRLGTNPFAVEAQGVTVGILDVEADGAPVTDLVPYLGALAHLAVFREGASASAHNHAGGPEFAPFQGAVAIPGYAGPKLYFEHQFAEAGRYRVFTQLQRGKTVVTVPFDLEVAPRSLGER